MINKKYSVFIAYHGSYDQYGSRKYAKLLYDYLEERGIRCFFFPECSINGNYKANIKEILESNLFLLVCTSGIKVEDNGKINIREHLDLYVEIDTFWGLTQIGDVLINDSSVIAIGQDFKKGSESLLHPLFQDRVALQFDTLDATALESISIWINNRLNEKQFLIDGQSFEVKKLYAKRNNIKLNKLQKMVESAHHVMSVGISNSTICDMNMEESITKFLNNGGLIEVLYLDPDAENTQKRALEEQIRVNRIVGETKSKFDFMLDVISGSNHPENGKLLLYNLVPRINALFIDDILILQYYSYNNMGKDNPILYIEKNNQNSPLFQFTLATYNYIKNNSYERRTYYAV